MYFYYIVPRMDTKATRPDLEDTITQSGDVSSDIGDNNQPGGTSSPSTVAIAAGVTGGIMGLVALVAICICVGCLSRHVQVHVHYSDNKDQTEPRDTRTASSSDSEMLVHQNAAYRSTIIRSTNGSIGEQGTWSTRSHSGHRSTEKDIERCESEERRRQPMTINTVDHQGNQMHMEINSPKRPAVPLPYELLTSEKQRNLFEDEDHLYEYVL